MGVDNLFFSLFAGRKVNKESEDGSPCPDISGDDIDDRYKYACTVCAFSAFPIERYVSTCRPRDRTIVTQRIELG
jgi:hypothetical protein